jgi:hypothetical protein
MGILTSAEIANRFTGLQKDMDELRELVHEFMAGRSGGVQAAFGVYGGKLDELRAKHDELGRIVAEKLDERVTHIEEQIALALKPDVYSEPKKRTRKKS